MPRYHSYHVDRVVTGRIPHGADLLDALQMVVAQEKIYAGAVTLIGAVRRGRLLYYDQGLKTYTPLPPVERPCEIVSGIGNVSIRENLPFVHLHLSLSDREGAMIGGHLAGGTEVFACEFSITVLTGPPLIREHDDVTGLNLWVFDDGHK